MANHDHSIKLDLDHYAVVAGGTVTLTATLSKTVGELANDKIAVEFTVDSQPAVVVVEPRRSDKVVEASWTAPIKQDGKPAAKTVTATARLTQSGSSPAVGLPSEQTLLILPRTAKFMRATPRPPQIPEGGFIRLEAEFAVDGRTEINDATMQQLGLFVNWTVPHHGTVLPDDPGRLKATWDTTGVVPGNHEATVQLVDRERIPVIGGGGGPIEMDTTADVLLRPLSRGDILPVTLRRSVAARTKEQPLWSLIRERTRALSFTAGYKSFVDKVLCDPDPAANSPEYNRLAGRVRKLRTHAYGMAAYDLLKMATEVFLLVECGVAIDKSFTGNGFDPDAEAGRLGERVLARDLRDRLKAYFPHGRLPYLERVVDAAFPDADKDAEYIFCPGALSSRVSAPCLLELIWSYWHEEGMLVQTMNAISRRFQNVRGPGDRDPLAHLEVDPLRPLNNLLWGYVQDEHNLLTVKRRAYEYDHQYGLTIQGKAVPPLRPADSRSKFLEGFHSLLHITSVFYKEDNDTTVIADGFSLLNALREVHLLLAQGAGNQFGDLPWTARAEMLTQQWLLSRPEMREFLQSRPMVPYKEPWMSQVDTMKSLQGWSDVTVTHFRDLGAYGEQILLSIRYGDWIDVNDEDSAKNWARYWRPEIQSYTHAYRTVTGVDLTNSDTVDYAMPSLHLKKRLALQRAR